VRAEEVCACFAPALKKLLVRLFGAAKPHCAYLFANRRANQMKVLAHDGVVSGLPRGDWI
jgi:hypothetical protein